MAPWKIWSNNVWNGTSLQRTRLLKSRNDSDWWVKRTNWRCQLPILHLHSQISLEAIQTLRYKWINRAGALVHPDGYPTLDVGSSPEVKNRFTELDTRLQKAA